MTATPTWSPEQSERAAKASAHARRLCEQFHDEEVGVAIAAMASVLVDLYLEVLADKMAFDTYATDVGRVIGVQYAASMRAMEQKKES